MEGQPESVIKAAQESRIRHLEKEVKTFRENIEKLNGGSKMELQVTKIGGREVFVGSVENASAFRISAPFVVLMSAACQDEVHQGMTAAAVLIDQGCEEFCCVGSEAEVLHDRLDALIEDAGDLSVLTTWHENVNDGCEYFLFAAGAQRMNLLALIEKDSDVLHALRAVGSD